jgi:hypothetical protein
VHVLGHLGIPHLVVEQDIGRVTELERQGVPTPQMPSNVPWSSCWVKKGMTNRSPLTNLEDGCVAARLMSDFARLNNLRRKKLHTVRGDRKAYAIRR